MLNALFIFNPQAGGRLIARQISLVLSRLESHGFKAQSFNLTGTQDNQALVTILTQKQFDLIVISGGDGSINYVTNIILKCNLTTPIGIIPSGTSNDLARNLNIPLDLKSALDRILMGKTSPIDAGLINDSSYFLSSCAGGLFADISYQTDGELKKNLGPFAYYLRGIHELSQIKPFTLTVETETGVFQESILLFFVLNGPNVAGLSNLVKEAGPSDGYLYLVLVKNCATFDLAGLFFNIMGRFSLRTHTKVKIISGTKFRLKSDRKIIVSVDGEKGRELPIELKVARKKLNVFV